jgi:hypothetical protein
MNYPVIEYLGSLIVTESLIHFFNEKKFLGNTRVDQYLYYYNISLEKKKNNNTFS